MLRLFVDDSGSGGDSPWFVLSGLTSTVGKWAEFTDEWDHQLRTNPKVDYLRMSEAESLKKQFEGFSVPERDAKVLALARIVRRHVLYKTHLLIDHPAFDAILWPKIPKKLQSPYVFAFNGMISATALYEQRLGRHEPIECVFDKQQKIGTRAARLYERVVGLPGFEACHLVQFPIRFEDEKAFLPIQGADLVAWHVRRRYSNQDEPKRAAYELLSKPLRENFTYKVRSKNLTAMARNFDPATLQKFLKALRDESDDESK